MNWVIWIIVAGVIQLGIQSGSGYQIDSPVIKVSRDVRSHEGDSSYGGPHRRKRETIPEMVTERLRKILGYQFSTKPDRFRQFFVNIYKDLSKESAVVPARVARFIYSLFKKVYSSVCKDVLKCKNDFPQTFSNFLKTERVSSQKLSQKLSEKLAQSFVKSWQEKNRENRAVPEAELLKSWNNVGPTRIRSNFIFRPMILNFHNSMDHVEVNKNITFDDLTIPGDPCPENLPKTEMPQRPKTQRPTAHTTEVTTPATSTPKVYISPKIGVRSTEEPEEVSQTPTIVIMSTTVTPMATETSPTSTESTPASTDAISVTTEELKGEPKDDSKNESSDKLPRNEADEKESRATTASLSTVTALPNTETQTTEKEASHVTIPHQMDSIPVSVKQLEDEKLNVSTSTAQAYSEVTEESTNISHMSVTFSPTENTDSADFTSPEDITQSTPDVLATRPGVLVHDMSNETGQVSSLEPIPILTSSEATTEFVPDVTQPSPVDQSSAEPVKPEEKSPREPEPETVLSTEATTQLTSSEAENPPNNFDQIIPEPSVVIPSETTTEIILMSSTETSTATDVTPQTETLPTEALIEVANAPANDAKNELPQDIAAFEPKNFDFVPETLPEPTPALDLSTQDVTSTEALPTSTEAYIAPPENKLPEETFIPAQEPEPMAVDMFIPPQEPEIPTESPSIHITPEPSSPMPDISTEAKKLDELVVATTESSSMPTSSTFEPTPEIETIPGPPAEEPFAPIPEPTNQIPEPFPSFYDTFPVAPFPETFEPIAEPPPDTVSIEPVDLIPTSTTAQVSENSSSGGSGGGGGGGSKSLKEKLIDEMFALDGPADSPKVVARIQALQQEMIGELFPPELQYGPNTTTTTTTPSPL